MKEGKKQDMYKEFFLEDVEDVLRSDAVIPKSVEERIEETYKKLNLKKNNKTKKNI